MLAKDRRRLSQVAAALLLVVASSSTAQGQPSQTARALRAIQAAYTGHVTALRRKDIDAERKFYTPDLTVSMPDGTVMNRHQAMASRQDDFRHIRSIRKWAIQIRRIRIVDDKAFVLVRERISLSLADGSGHCYRLEDTAFSRDTWTRTKAGWKMARSVVLRSCRHATPL